MNYLLRFLSLLSLLLLIFSRAGAQVPAECREAEEVTFMTYNIRLDVATDGENAWPRRRDFLASQVRFHRPDVLGIQEGLPGQVAWLNEHLTEYAYVGEGRDGGDRGEYSAVFYDRHRLEVVRSGTFWLSPTPEVPSKGWDAALNRICTWARFRDRAGGPDFLVFNTHFDHVGEEARKNGARLLLTMADSLNPAELPYVVMGDFNLTPETLPIQQLSAALLDAYEAAPLRLGPAGTFTGFQHDRPATRRIDYVFVGNLPATAITRFATLTDAVGGRYASDHFPLLTSLHPRPRPLVIAHRGASGYGLENSLDAFRKATEMGADMVELDVFTLADGEVVCFHDKTLERLTGTEGKITDLTLAELNQLTLSDGSRIPTLRQALRVMDKKLRVNVELKGPDTAEPTYAILREFIRDEGWKIEDFHVSSFRHDELKKMRMLDARIEIGILPHGAPLRALDVAREVKAYSINAHFKSLNAESVAQLRAAGLRIFAWTTNEHREIRRLLDLGIDGFITNYPDRVRTLLRE